MGKSQMVVELVRAFSFSKCPTLCQGAILLNKVPFRYTRNFTVIYSNETIGKRDFAVCTFEMAVRNCDCQPSFAT